MKLYGVKKAVGLYQSIQVKPWYMPQWSGNIMVDTDSGEVWCDIFDNKNSWKEYNDKAIKSITNSEYRFQLGYTDVNMKNVRKIAKIIIEKAGQKNDDTMDCTYSS